MSVSLPDECPTGCSIPSKLVSEPERSFLTPFINLGDFHARMHRPGPSAWSRRVPASVLTVPLALRRTMLAALASSSTAFQVPSKLSVSKVAEAVAPVLAAGVLVTGAMPAFAGDASAGEKIFSGNCAACHAGGQNVIMPEKTLEQSALEQYLDGGFNEGAVVKQVTNGKNAMPAFGGRLSDNDIKNVASYVITTSEAGWD